METQEKFVEERKVLVVSNFPYFNEMQDSLKETQEIIFESGIYIDLINFTNPVEALKYVKGGNNLDVVIFNDFFEEMTGIDFFRSIKSMEKKPLTVLVTAKVLFSEKESMMINNSGIDFTYPSLFSSKGILLRVFSLLKEFCPSITKQVKDIFEKIKSKKLKNEEGVVEENNSISDLQEIPEIFLQEKVNKNVEAVVTNALADFKVKRNLKGFQYIREGIMMCIEDKKYLDSITKELYPDIAKKYNSTGTRVERGIRHCIETMFSVENEKALDKYFGYSISSMKGKPTNSEFIATIVDYIKINKLI